MKNKFGVISGNNSHIFFSRLQITGGSPMTVKQTKRLPCTVSTTSPSSNILPSLEGTLVGKNGCNPSSTNSLASKAWCMQIISPSCSTILGKQLQVLSSKCSCLSLVGVTWIIGWILISLLPEQNHPKKGKQRTCRNNRQPEHSVGVSGGWFVWFGFKVFWIVVVVCSVHGKSVKD